MQFQKVRSDHELDYLQGLWLGGFLTVLMPASVGGLFFILKLLEIECCQSALQDLPFDAYRQYLISY